MAHATSNSGAAKLERGTFVGDVVAGIDNDFIKGSTEVSRFNGDPERNPNACLGSIGMAPFCAMQLWPADADAAADAWLATDADARVLSEDGQPIEGL
jgi:hypothetical protein